MKETLPFIITISRQLGSGGAYVGQQLAKKLNIFYADREIIIQAAKQFSVLEEDLESSEEKKSSFWQSIIQSYGFGTLDAFVPPQITLPTDSILFKAESEIITHIARERSAIIIGRCGSHILRDFPNHVSIFLHADLPFRKGRIQQVYKLSDNEATEKVIQSDKDRSLYYHAFTGKEREDSTQYDISLNTGKIGIDESVEIILKYIEYIQKKV